MHLLATYTAITCMPLTVVGNGGITVTYSPNTTDDSGNYYYFRTTASYNCSSGFGLNGPQSRMCVDDGTGMGLFNGSEPTCERKFSISLDILVSTQYSSNLAV